MSLKDTIKDLCKKNGVNMSSVEEKLGFASGYLSKLDKSTPNTKRIQKIADYFGVTVDYLMTGKEPEEKKNKLPNNLGVQTIAAHLDGEELGENEIRDILNFIDFVKSKKK